MADALVSSVLKQLATVIKDEVKQEARLVVGVEDEITKLTITFEAIQLVLKDAEHKQFKDELVKLWLEEFKDVVYDMDDVLDEWSTEMLIKSQIIEIENAPNHIVKKVLSFLGSVCSCFDEVGLRHDIGVRIKNIRERSDFISSEKDNYRLIETKSNDESKNHPVTSSLIEESSVYGRSLEKENIIRKLLGGSDGSSSSSTSGQQQTGSSPTIMIISIVGMGGIGKTTLAQLIINNERVKNHFEKTMWVCVSDPFDQHRLAEAIIREAGGYVPNNNPVWNELHKSLYKSVKGMRFLLVLDDVWNEDTTKWQPFEDALKSGEQGSRILVTTRNKKIAKIMMTTHFYDLEILSDNDCWSLIRDKSFFGRGKEEQETLTEIGFEIAKKCKGLPLAAKALGSLLLLKTTRYDWENVLESEIWEIKDVENDFLKPALLLSYLDLPSPLKLCFAYCSIFPKDYPMEKDVLVKLWMAQGFLNSNGRREDLERIGEEYFENLVSRSFFQDFEYYHGNMYRCKMHDLMHDFAQFLMENECCVTRMSDTHTNNKIRHLSLIGEPQESSFDASIYEAKNLRTFQLLGANVSELPSSFFSSFSCLRALHLKGRGLSNTNLKIFSSEVGKFMHLRYLNLSDNNQLTELPESITTLYNLQTLNLAYCKCLRKLPEEMWKMNNLRHLDIKECEYLKYLPQGIGKLTSLRTLNYFPLSRANFFFSAVTTQGSCKIEELKDLNHLEGKLKINGLGGVKTKNEAVEARLKYKNGLRVLELDFGDGFFFGEEFHFREELDFRGVLEGLEPHPKLETLILWNYTDTEFPMWIGDSSILSHLKVLSLYGCNNCIEFPTLGKLPSLEVLYIHTMNRVRQIGLESFGPSSSTCRGVMKLFPKLKQLKLQKMDSLEELGDRDAEDSGHLEIMPCLVYLNIQRCPKLKSLPRKLLNLEELDYDYSPSLSQLPFLPKLTCLKISGRSSAAARLPQGLLAQLQALQRLEIFHFPELSCVPEELKHLTNLQELCIEGCEKLVPRCEKVVGEDWSIISHIPHIYIGGDSYLVALLMRRQINVMSGFAPVKVHHILYQKSMHVCLQK